jgi:hypothetical protein
MCFVEWQDALMNGHWHDDAPNPLEDLTVYSVGFLLHEDAKRIVMVQSLTDGSYGNELQIPRGMVTKLTKIPL